MRLLPDGGTATSPVYRIQTSRSAEESWLAEGPARGGLDLLLHLQVDGAGPAVPPSRAPEFSHYD